MTRIPAPFATRSNSAPYRSARSPGTGRVARRSTARAQRGSAAGAVNLSSRSRMMNPSGRSPARWTQSGRDHGPSVARERRRRSELRAVTEPRDVRQLLSRPGFGRTPCDSDADHLLRVDVDDEEREERTEPDVVGLQEVAGPHRMVAQEGVPPLAARRSRWSDRADVLLDCPLGDVDAELQ